MTDEAAKPKPDLVRLRSRGRWTAIALVVVAVVDLIAVVSDVAEYRLLGADFTVEEIDANDTRQGVIGAVQVLLLIVTAVFFIRWFKRAYENVDAVGGKRRHGPGWAIGSWFIPIANLWFPKRIANDIWRASNVPGDESVSPILTLWWVAFVLASWASQVAGRLNIRAETIDDFRNASVAYVIGDSLDFVAAGLAIWVVRTVTARQVADVATEY
jgi:uncharacterized membrane protein